MSSLTDNEAQDTTDFPDSSKNDPPKLEDNNVRVEKVFETTGKYSDLTLFYNNVIRFEQGGYHGIMKNDGAVIIPANKYIMIIPESPDYFLCYEKNRTNNIPANRWGLIDKSGNVLLPCEYSSIDIAGNLIFTEKKVECSEEDAYLVSKDIYGNKIYLLNEYAFFDPSKKAFCKEYDFSNMVDMHILTHDNYQKIEGSNLEDWLQNKIIKYEPLYYIHNNTFYTELPEELEDLDDHEYDFLNKYSDSAIAKENDNDYWAFYDADGNAITEHIYIQIGKCKYDMFYTISEVANSFYLGFTDYKGNTLLEIPVNAGDYIDFDELQSLIIQYEVNSIQYIVNPKTLQISDGFHNIFKGDINGIFMVKYEYEQAWGLSYYDKILIEPGAHDDLTLSDDEKVVVTQDGATFSIYEVKIN